MRFTIWMESDEGTVEPIALAQIERNGPVAAATLGLTLAESKGMLAAVQRELVRAQFREYLAARRTCRMCGGRRKVKVYHSVSFKSLFGNVSLRVPRLFGCDREGKPERARTVKLMGLEGWVAPELEYLQSHLAATVPYARTTRLLELLLPVVTGNAVSTVRRRTLAVGERLDREVHQAADVDDTIRTCKPAVVAMGLDSGYVRHCRPNAERSFEVVAGRTLARDSSSRSMGFVRTVEDDSQIRHRLERRIADHGYVAAPLVVFTDGDLGLRTMQLSALPKATHILDWFVRREVVQLFITQEVTHEVIRCFATGSPPRRAGLATVRCGALGTMYPWSQGRSRRRKATATTGSIVRCGG